MFPIRIVTAVLAASLALVSLQAEVSEMQAQLMRPCLKIETDVGENAKERKAKAKFYAKHIADTSTFFLKVFELEAQTFVDYAEKRHRPDSPYRTEIRVRVWRRYEEFLKDFQKRYETKTIPGAFFGIIQEKDEYGEKGAWFREIGAHAEGQTDEEVLRHLYHEMGHLFMRTYMFYPVEVPSWMEEGTAELFQYREKNGTNPEADRTERLGYLREMIDLEEGTLGASIDWADFMGVRNAHNLAFTHENPLRSTIQYAQAWSVMEFMIDSPARGRAYTKLLKSVKAEAEWANREAQRKGLKGEAYFKFVNDHIYNRQFQLFKKAYGTEPLSVEGKWKEWVEKTAKKELRSHPELYYHRGIWHMHYRARFAKTKEEKQKILAKAEAIFREGIEEAPRAPESYVGMGRLAMQRGKSEETATWFGKAAELGTDNFEALLYGGVANLHNAEAGKAVASLEKAVEQRPSHFEANYHLGRALAVQGEDHATAITHLNKAADIKPDQRAQPSMLAGITAYQGGDFRQAHIFFLRAQQGMPNNKTLAVMDALAQYANAETDTAKQMLNLAAQQGNEIAKEALTRIEAGRRLRPGFSPTGQVGIFGLTLKEPEAEAVGE